MALAFHSSTETLLNDSEFSCPFTWGIEQLIKYKRIMEDRDLNEYDFQDIPLMSFITRLVYSAECVLTKRDVDKAVIILKDCEMMLEKIRSMFEESIRSIEHIFYATKYHFLLRTEDADEAQNIRNKIVAISDLNDVELSALFGCKGCALCLYHGYFIDEAIECTKRAIKCNPTHGFWYFNFAHALRKRRRINSYRSKASELEFRNFQKASELCDSVYYKLYYLQSEQERWGFNHPDEWQKKRAITLNRLSTYEEMLRAEGNNALIMLRIVLALIRISKLSRRCGDYDIEKTHVVLAHKILDRVDAISPENSTSRHYRGCLFLQMRDNENAQKCFREAADLGNVAAALSYTDALMYNKNSNFSDVIQYLQRILELHEGSSYEQAILVDIGICYFLRAEVTTAVEYILKGIQLNPDSERLRVFYKFGWFKEGSIYYFVRKRFLPTLKKRITNANFRKSLETLKKMHDSHVEQLRYTKLLKLLTYTKNGHENIETISAEINYWTA